MFVSAAFAIFILLLDWIYFPELPKNNGLSVVLAPALNYMGLVIELLALVSIFICLVNAVQFWRFYRKHSLQN